MNRNNQILVWDLFVRVFPWSLVLFFIVAYATGEDKNSLHRYVGYGVLGLVAARIFLGVTVSSILHNENLDRAMFTGKKA